MGDEVYRLHAEVCKVMAHPTRLEIINALRSGEASLVDLAAKLDVPKPNVSQHLSQMRHRGIVERRREAGNVYYRLTDLKIVKACDLMREVLLDQLERQRAIADKITSGLSRT